MEYNSTIIHVPGVLVKCICRYWPIDLIYAYLGGLCLNKLRHKDFMGSLTLGMRHRDWREYFGTPEIGINVNNVQRRTMPAE